MVINKMIKNIIKKMRKEKNLTQKELADLINVAQTTLSGYETGYSNPEFSLINKIANICDYEIQFVNTKNNNKITINKKS